MKKILTLSLFTVFALSLHAQISPEQQKQIDDAKKKLQQVQNDPAIRQKMQQAQHVLDSLKGDKQLQDKMQQAGSQVSEAQKDHPEAAGIAMPDLNNIGNIPNLDSVAKQLNKGTQMMSQYTGALNQTTPKPDLTHHAEKLPALTKTSLQNTAAAILKEITAKIDPFKMADLKHMVDSCKNLAGLGAFLLANDASVNETMYIICSALVKKPTDIWSVNNLGVYYRDRLQYEAALQCYFYANALDSGKSTVLDVNIAWAALYYGDFGAADKYFAKALTIDSYFLSALEGQALMAFSRGDLTALFKCMTKEVEVMMNNVKGIKMGPKGGKKQKAEEPSDEFADQTATAYLQSVKNMDDQPDPTQDHSLDNLADEGPDQDPPPGADEEDVTYPEYRPIFVGSATQLRAAQGSAVKFMHSAITTMTSLQQNLSQQMSSLKPLAGSNETDGNGTLVVNKSFRKFVDLFVEASWLFERRVSWHKQQFLKKIKPLPINMHNHAQDMQDQYFRDLGGCPADEPQHTSCVNRVNCNWIPIMTTSCNSDIESVTRVWNEYSNNVHEDIQWYINISGPLISRIHDVGWNNYVNSKRIAAVRTAVLESYSNWAADIQFIPVPVLVGQPVPICPTDINGMDPPDPFSQKPKHIREYPGPCYDLDYSMSELAGIQETCHTIKYYLGKGPIKVFWETVKDPLYAQDNNYTNKVGTTIGVSKLIGIEEENEEAKLKFSAGVNLKAEASAWAQWNDKGQFTGAGSSVSAGVEAGADISKGDLKFGGSTGVGIDASNTYKVVAGQLQTGPPVVTVTH